MVNSSGTIQNHIKYDSFGSVTAESNSAVDHQFGFASRDRDESIGLCLYRSRYYDPSVGEFTADDLVGVFGRDAHLGRYVGNSPTNFIDPFGYWADEPTPRDGEDWQPWDEGVWWLTEQTIDKMKQHYKWPNTFLHMWQQGCSGIVCWHMSYNAKMPQFNPNVTVFESRLDADDYLKLIDKGQKPFIFAIQSNYPLRPADPDYKPKVPMAIDPSRIVINTHSRKLEPWEYDWNYATLIPTPELGPNGPDLWQWVNHASGRGLGTPKIFQNANLPKYKAPPVYAVFDPKAKQK